ncbi:4177_t:CDS:2 [Rhizophagus irregularis]|nr:4177_t:CDS:2 [Rhizophagus irregularis]
MFGLWKLSSEDFYHLLESDALIHVLSEYNQRLNPIEVWDKLIEWAIGQSNELPKNTKEWTNNEMTIFGTIINPFITHINFEKISLTNFCKTGECFIFSLDKKELEKFVFSKVVDENHAVYRNRGPDFGEKTSDLRLIEGDAKKEYYEDYGYRGYYYEDVVTPEVWD